VDTVSYQQKAGERDMGVTTFEKICPVCNTHNPGDARFCGKDGVSLESVVPTPIASRKSVIPDLAGALGVANAAIVGVAGISQLVLSGAGSHFYTTASSTELTVSGLWNLAVAAAYALIACGLFVRQKRAYEWGIGTSVINVIFSVLQAGQGGAVPIVLAVPNALMAVLVYMSKSELKGEGAKRG
jgi:hypothetical protein